MDCPECKKRRRRSCPACGWRFTTYEVYSHNMIDEKKIQKDTETLVESLVSASISIEHLLELTKKQIL